MSLLSLPSIHHITSHPIARAAFHFTAIASAGRSSMHILLGFLGDRSGPVQGRQVQAPSESQVPTTNAAAVHHFRNTLCLAALLLLLYKYNCHRWKSSGAMHAARLRIDRSKQKQKQQQLVKVEERSMPACSAQCVRRSRQGIFDRSAAAAATFHAAKIACL
jgi:hypothetical protein